MAKSEKVFVSLRERLWCCCPGKARKDTQRQPIQCLTADRDINCAQLISNVDVGGKIRILIENFCQFQRQTALQIVTNALTKRSNHFKRTGAGKKWLAGA